PVIVNLSSKASAWFYTKPKVTGTCLGLSSTVYGKSNVTTQVKYTLIGLSPRVASSLASSRLHPRGPRNGARGPPRERRVPRQSPADGHGSPRAAHGDGGGRAALAGASVREDEDHR